MPDAQHPRRVATMPGLAAPKRRGTFPKAAPKPQPDPDAENQDDLLDDTEPAELDLDGVEPEDDLNPPTEDDDDDTDLDLDGLTPDDPDGDDLMLEDDPAPVPKPAVPRVKKPTPPAAKQPPADAPAVLETQPEPTGAELKNDSLVQQAAQLAQQERARQEVQQSREATTESYDHGGVDSLTGLCETLRSAGCKFSVMRLRDEMLIQLEDLGFINEARKIAKVDSERMTTLTGPFVPAGKLIPLLYELGWQPVHRTGIDASYPPQERYELTMTNEVIYITVVGRYDWANMQTYSTIRYATEGELRRYGLLQDAEDGMFEATASGNALALTEQRQIKFVPSPSFFGRAVANCPVLYDDTELSLMRNNGYVSEFGALRGGQPAAVRCDNGQLAGGNIQGFLPNETTLPLVLVVLPDGYALVPHDELFVGGA